MDQLPLPGELCDLEMRLASRPKPEPAGDFRQRVLSAMRLAGNQRRAAFSARWGWRVASAAAAVFLALNMWLGLENEQSSSQLGGAITVTLETTTAEIRKREPDLPEPEARQLAMLLVASARLTPRPDPASLSNAHLFEKEVASWDIP